MKRPIQRQPITEALLRGAGLRIESWSLGLAIHGCFLPSIHGRNQLRDLSLIELLGLFEPFKPSQMLGTTGILLRCNWRGFHARVTALWYQGDEVVRALAA